ncbi:MBL fold metallo-hydrolase [Anaerobacillus sp. MEB173]|uniref:MBL fold metallo-hydrolase n=1 Tax=Anaerobacillus sp. MEB173 TaxID=3383345 RepID=UPI003F92FE52
MKLTVVGHWGAYPEQGEATSGYLLEHNGFTLLIDCGSGVLSHMQQFASIEQLDAVILSHYHQDHIADIGPLQYARLIATQLGKITTSLPVYGHTYDQAAFQQLGKEPYVVATPYHEDDTLQVGPFTITFSKTIHPAPCFAMRIECESKVIVYSADTAYYEELIDFTKHADLIICEASFYAGQTAATYGHMNSTDAAKVAQKAYVKHLLLTHHPHFGNVLELEADAKKHFQGNVNVASLGWNIEL